MRVPGYRGSKFCWALCQGSDLTSWDPLPDPLLEEAAGAVLVLPTLPPSLQAMACVHTVTQPHPSPQAPGKDFVQPGPQPGNTPGFRHNFPFFPGFDPSEAIVPVGDGLRLACGTGSILAGASSRRP